MNDDAGVMTKHEDAGAKIEIRVCTAMEEPPNTVQRLTAIVKADFRNLLGGRMASQATASAAEISRSRGLAK